MDFNTCNHKKLNQFQAEARLWQTKQPQSSAGAPKRGQKTQPAKRKKKGK